MRIKDARQTFLGIWLRRVIEGEPFEVWGGEQRRDLLYVDDAAEAFLYAAHGGGKYEIREFPAERKRIDIGDFITDDRRFRAISGWHPRVRLADGLRRSLDYYRRHLACYL